MGIAEQLLRRMDYLYRNGDEDMKPNTRTFTSVIDSWAKSGDRRSAERANEILLWMEKLYKEGNKDVKPNTISYSAVINVSFYCTVVMFLYSIRHTFTKNFPTFMLKYIY